MQNVYTNTCKSENFIYSIICSLSHNLKQKLNEDKKCGTTPMPLSLALDSHFWEWL